MIPTLFPSLAYSSLSLSVPFHLRFLHRPPRFSTRKEVTLNALTLIAAVLAGASQVCFSGLSFFCFTCHIRHFPTDGCFR